MKRFILFLLLATSVVAIAPEDITLDGFVIDEADIYTPQEETVLIQELQNIYNSGKAEMAIVTTSSLEGQDAAGYALTIAQGNLGDEESDNGLLLLIAPNEREYRFEVGRGLEAYLNDAKVGRIGRYELKPAFKSKEYALGTRNAINAIKGELEIEGAQKVSYPEEEFTPNDALKLIPWVIFIIFILVSLHKGKGKRDDSDYFTAAFIASQMFRGGGGNSGGFGGFGGGGFGGGGAGGSW